MPTIFLDGISRHGEVQSTLPVFLPEVSVVPELRRSIPLSAKRPWVAYCCRASVMS